MAVMTKSTKRKNEVEKKSDQPKTAPRRHSVENVLCKIPLFQQFTDEEILTFLKFLRRKTTSTGNTS